MQPLVAKFSDLQKSQPQAVAHLCRAIAHARLPHGVLVVGAPSTPVAALCAALGQRLCCTAAVPATLDACGNCTGCMGWANGVHPNVLKVDTGAKTTIAVAQIRDIARKLSRAGAQGGTQVILISEAERMALPAQNALLKTLEEPPGAACIILAASHRRTMLPTIMSRVLPITLRPPAQAQSAAALARAGIALPYAEYLAPWVGTDIALAQHMMDEGLVHVVETIHQGLTLGLSATETGRIAQDLAAKPETFTQALAIMGLLLRDALAQQGHAPQSAWALSGAPGPLVHLAAARLAQACDALMILRRRLHLNINRTQALEGLLLTINHRGTL